MTKKNYAMNVSIILGVSAALLLFIFILVSHHHGIAERVRLGRGALLSTAPSVAERIKPVGQVSVASAETQKDPVKDATTAPSPPRNGQQVYQTTCIACHGAGIAGAPKVEDKGQWAARIAKGVDALYASSVKGVQGSAGVMPPRGGNPALSDAELRAAVEYMVARSK